LTEIKGFVGETPELVAVLTLLSEKVEKGVMFDVFQKKLKNYAIKNFNKKEDISILIANLEDPLKDFETNNAPMNLSTTEAANQMEVKKWEMNLKMYLLCEENLWQNIVKNYGIVIGQCTPALRSTLKSDNDYTTNSMAFNSLWLLKKLKALTARVDSTANLSFSLHEQILFFFNTHQGQMESDDDYLVRFNSHARVLEMSGGEHILSVRKCLAKQLVQHRTLN